MNKEIYNDLQIREIFHLEFLRRFARKIKAGLYAVKGGANLRFFFKSVRYSDTLGVRSTWNSRKLSSFLL